MKKEGDEVAEKKEVAAPAAPPASAEALQATALLSQIQQGFELQLKEVQSLGEKLEVAMKEQGQLRADFDTAMNALATFTQTSQAQTKELQEKLALSDAKVKELAAEVPNAARSAYIPGAAVTNILNSIGSGATPPPNPVDQIQAAIKQANIANPASVNSDPINSFITTANQAVGLAKPPVNLPQ